MQKTFKTKLWEHYQLVGVLVAAFIVLASMGTYTNWDAQLEYEALTSVVTRGFPYLSTGLMINQPPLAFYTTASAMHLFGLSYPNAVWFVTAWGLGCSAAVYALGMLVYGKKTGLVAAALLGFVPWQVFISRAYLMDAQYLFWGLLFVCVGVLAVRRNSDRLLAASGVLFALAFLTKLFSVFFLLPLLLVILLKRKEVSFKLSIKKILIFFAPTLILQAIWYGGLANQNFFGVYVASDVTHPVLIADPSLMFLPRIFVESAGWFLPAAAVFSLVLAVFFKEKLAKTAWADIVCSLTVLMIVCVDLGLVLGAHLLVPYVSAFKYNYAALPFVCLLAASVADKGALLIRSADKRRIVWVLVGVGLMLVFASLIESVIFLNHSEPYPIVDFKVDYVGHYFPFFVNTAVSSNFQAWHLAAIVVILISLTTPYFSKAIKKKVVSANDS